MLKLLPILGLFLALESNLFADPDYNKALRRAQYLLNGSNPTDEQYNRVNGDLDAFRQSVREMILDERFYNSVFRYHERILGIGLPDEYLTELISDHIDGKSDKFAAITCFRSSGANGRFRCDWSSQIEDRRAGSCPPSQEVAASVFWYEGLSAWVCPSVVNACGYDLSRCFVQYINEEEAQNSELGTTEAFDSRYAVIKSLSRQAAGLATAIVVENYPYTKILEPGVTAVDGAVAHFYQQEHHFKINELNLNPQVIELLPQMSLTDTRFKLIKTGGDNYAQGGVISSFGFLRRYDKRRTRANELYKRLLCREFSAELPAVFPQDPGNLRTAAGCQDCHSVLDPLADFFQAWGEGAEIYRSHGNRVSTNFGTCEGNSLESLARCMQGLSGFSTCTVQNVWKWMMGRTFYKSEEGLRTQLNSYFQTTGYSFRELVYAVATHPAFVEGARSDAAVTDPLEEPPLGEFVANDVECTTTINYATDIAPVSAQYCDNCHTGSGNRQSLTTEAQWQSLGETAVGMILSRQMPPASNSPALIEFADKVTCWLRQ